jgi:putative ABC transport system substrate-binding protein
VFQVRDSLQTSVFPRCTTAVPSILIAVVLLALGVTAEAQQTKKVPRIGVLWLFLPIVGPPLAEAFRQGLRNLGYVEGQNIAIEYRYSEGKDSRLPDLAGELLRLKVCHLS